MKERNVHCGNKARLTRPHYFNWKLNISGLWNENEPTKITDRVFFPCKYSEYSTVLTHAL